MTTENKFPSHIWIGESCDEWGLSKPDNEYSMEYISKEHHEEILRQERSNVKDQCIDLAQDARCGADWYSDLRDLIRAIGDI